MLEPKRFEEERDPSRRTKAWSRVDSKQKKVRNREWKRVAHVVGGGVWSPMEKTDTSRVLKVEG